MPTKFYGYGRASSDTQVASPETQRDLIRREFEHQKLTGLLPADAEWGGFWADTATCRITQFLERPSGIFLAMAMNPGDRLCVSAFDRLIGSPGGCESTLAWAREKQIHLVIMDMRIDSSTPVGQCMLEAMSAFKKYERSAINQRCKDGIARKKREGLPYNGVAPIGYRIGHIIPVGGGRQMKYYLPWLADRRYCDRIVLMHDQMGLSYEKISLKLWKEKVLRPRTGGVDIKPQEIMKCYHAVQNNYPLFNGVQWKPPAFKYKIVAKSRDLQPINLNVVSA